MFRHQTVQRRVSWIAILAFALNAFWPLISLANPSSPAIMVEVCGAMGMQTMPLDGVPAQDEDGAKKVPQCPLCSVFGGADSAPAPAAIAHALSAASVGPCFFQEQPSRLLAPFFPAQSRAPPVFS